MLGVVRSDDRCFWGILAGRCRRRIDPNGLRRPFQPSRLVHEAVEMGGVGGQARAMTGLEDRRGAAMAHFGRRQIPQPAVMMSVVVPADEGVADRARIFN